ncbi:5-hydroxytryptamine receptor 1D isoform X1 [Chiloscyllium plagiosum]|uniref:5-hydroxytryptamine receptor 1D isoform X1 n=1 Tax=Chiloscyllium plagiosum TaxID=36176 RepID=UPI001CB8136D|nr:5-hydroxytryptamine receptor 1D isoform X1 [Chiloscyllium plagiosum]
METPPLLLGNLSLGAAGTGQSRWPAPSASPPGSGSPSVPVKILLETIMVLMCLAAIAGNVLVITIIVVTKHFHSVTSVFLVNLAVSDCLVGLGVMPFVVLSVFYQDWNKYNDLCLYVGYTSSVYCTASVLTLAAIALDRYHAIIDCLQYNSQSTVRRTVATVVWIWLQSALSSCPPLLGWGRFGYSPAGYSCSVEWAHSLSYTGFVAIFSFLLPASVMVFCYARIVKVARGHAKRIHDIESQLHRHGNPGDRPSDRPTFTQLICSVDSRGCEETQTQAQGRARAGGLSKRPDIFSRCGSPGREHHGAFRLFLVIFAFFCCWVPYEIVGLVRAVEAAALRASDTRASPSASPSRVPPALVTAVHWLALLNSDINPLLYALLSRRFRKALRHWQRRLEAKVWLTGPRLRREEGAKATGGGGAAISLFLPNPGTEQKRSSSNATAISQLSPQHRLHARSCSVFSVSSFPQDRSPFDASADSPLCLLPERTSEEPGGRQSEIPGARYLNVPQHVPPETDTMLLSSPVLSEKSTSTFVFGKITVKVESNTVVEL